MRHSTLLIFSVLALSADAQDYLANEPIWHVRSICAVPVPCIATSNHNYLLVGDSVINGSTWSKVQEQGTSTLNWQGGGPADPGCQGTTLYTSPWLRLIRQEGRQLRIWADEADQLLHDFDLAVGDTLPLSYTNWNTDITVVAVDSVLIGTEMRARYELGNSWAQYLIEGVGTSHGLFEPVSNFLECGFSLECFGLGADAYYPPGVTGASCWLTMTMNESKAPTAWSLSPNPADDAVLINANGKAPWVVQVQDMRGRIVIVERLTNALNASLDVSHLSNGCYALSVDGAIPKRLVVAH
jgi:hypothetical protein